MKPNMKPIVLLKAEFHFVGNPQSLVNYMHVFYGAKHARNTHTKNEHSGPTQIC